MSNNSIFGEKQIALYNYDATYKKVEGLINVNVKYFCRFLVKKIVGFW